MKFCLNCHRTYPSSFANCPADGAPLIQSGEWVEGTVIRGKYRVVHKLGQGAMGSVYKALHTDFNEFHALKVMAVELAKQKVFVKRFKLEAVSARRLQHPNVVRVEDVDETEDGQPFIVMEHIQGRNLSDLMTAGPLAVDRVCSLVRQIASALDAAHSLDIVHRDIKPQNIMVVDSPSGEVAKVLDFGIARIKEAWGDATAMSLSHTGMVIGTPPYMSPEQGKGISGNKLDGRSDLYSLGVVMYQMLTGELPIKADTPIQFLFAHVHNAPIPISQARQDLHFPQPIADVVMKCLAKAPDQRFQTGRELIEEIDAFLSGSIHDQKRNIQPLSSSSLGESRSKNIQQPVRTFPITESEASVVSPTPKPRRSGSGVGKWIAAGVVIVAVLAVGGGYWIHASHERGSATSATSVVNQPVVTAPEAAPAVSASKSATAEALPAPATASPAAQPKAKKAESPKAKAVPVAGTPAELAPTPAPPHLSPQPAWFKPGQAMTDNFTNHDVTVTGLSPDLATVLHNFGTWSITSTGTTFRGERFNVTVTGSRIIFSNPGTASITYAKARFNGYQLTASGAPPITGVTVSSNNDGFDSSRIAFDATNIYVNMQGLTSPSGTDLVLDVQFMPTPSPSRVATPSPASAGALSPPAAPQAQSQPGQATTNNFTNHDVTLRGLYPDEVTVAGAFGTRTIKSTGTAFPPPFLPRHLYGVTVSGNQITISNPGTVARWRTASFNGFQFTSSAGTPAITGVTVGFSSNGFDSSRIAFDATNIYVNMQDVTCPSGTDLVLNIQFMPTPSPSRVERPSTLGNDHASSLTPAVDPITPNWNDALKSLKSDIPNQLMQKIGIWTEADAEPEFAQPYRRHDFVAANSGAISGDSYNYNSPVSELSDVQLNFDRETKLLKSASVILRSPVQWTTIREIMGTNYQELKPNGQSFYIYWIVKRRVGFLVNSQDNVVGVTVF